MLHKSKKHFLLLLFFFFLNLLFAPSVVAQQSKLSERWVCLHVDWCLDQDAFAQGKVVINPLCAPEYDAKGNQIPNGHRVRLTAKSDAKPLPSADTYIVECLATANGQICTTGNTTNDNIIYGKDNSAVLKTSDDYQFQGIFLPDGKTAATNPVKSKINGDINPVEWQSYSKGNARKFLALNYFDPNGGTGQMGTGGEQQGTFSFETQSNQKDCVSISWDPYGRVFDSQSLEPIPGVSVSLLKKRQDGSFTLLLPSEILGGALDNPYPTKDNGYYSFVVPDGTYQLSASKQNYIFPNDSTKLNFGYNKAYSELYPKETSSEIIQKGSVQHRDIPLDPVGQGVNYPVKLIEYFYNLDKPTNKVILEGLASHPLTNIRFYSIKPTGTSLALVRYKLLKTVKTDRYGKFKTEIDQSAFEPTEVYGDMELEKIDLTAAITSKQSVSKKIFSFLLRGVQNVEAAQASKSVIRFNPILNSLKGYAYDARKNILPNANVGIYLSYSGKPYYQLNTDENGYYEIASGRLPDSPYTIQYSTVGRRGQTTNTSKFIAQNSTYLEKNHINLNTGKTGSQATTVSPSPSKTTNFPTKNEGIKLNPTSSLAKNPQLAKGITQNNSILFIVVILLFLIAGAGGLLAFYIMNKNRDH